MPRQTRACLGWRRSRCPSIPSPPARDTAIATRHRRAHGASSRLRCLGTPPQPRTAALTTPQDSETRKIGCRGRRVLRDVRYFCFLRLCALPPSSSIGVATSHRDPASCGISGRYIRVRAGVYAPRAEWDRLKPWERYLARVHAYALVNPDAVFSHESAAALLGLPLFGEPRDIHTYDLSRKTSNRFGDVFVARQRRRAGGRHPRRSV